MLAVLVGMVGLVGDVGVWFAQRRDLQTITDAAVLAAAPWASNPTRARAEADAIVTANGLEPAETIQSFTTGYYCQDATMAAGSRFQTSRCATDIATAPANAVRIVAKGKAPVILSRVVVGASVSERAIGVSATATRINQAGMEAGAGLAAVNQGVVNAALSSLVGGSGVNLTLAQYEGLVNARVDTLAMLDALALKTGVSAGTYEDLLASQVSVGQLLDAAATVLSENNQVAGASAAAAGLNAIRAQIPGNPKVSLGALFDLGMWETLNIGHAGASTSALQAGLGVYELTTFALQLANRGNALALNNLSAGVPGIVSLTASATAIEPPSKSYFAFGPEGMTVHTASARLQMRLNLASSGAQNLGLGSGLSLPLYVEVAGGDAKLQSISCSGNPDTDTTVKVLARGGVADVYLGALSTARPISNFTNPITAADIVPWDVTGGVPSSGLLGSLLDLLGLNALLQKVVSVSLSAHVQVGSPTDTTLTFVNPVGTATTGGAITANGLIGRSASDRRGYSPPIPARAYSQNMGTALLDGLAESFQLKIQTCLIVLCIPGAPTTRIGVAAGPLFTALDPVLSSFDDTLDPLLRSLGLTVGYIDVFVTGVRCGAPVLVQ